MKKELLLLACHKMAVGILLLLASLTALAQPKNARQATNKGPNIIYIYADDLGYGELGSYGQQKIKTPHLDRMAGEGVRFTQHYASSPVCAPSRAMLMTGKHGGHSYIRGNYELGGFADSVEGGQMPLPEGTFTVAHLLKKAGYTTALFGKWGLGMVGTSGTPLKQGFDHYYGYLDQKQAHNFYPTHLWENDRWDSLENPFIYVHRSLDPAKATDADFESFKGKVHSQGLITDKALQFMEQHKAKPFFMYVPYTLPHLSLQVPDAYVDRYKGQFDEQPYYGQNGYAAHKYPRSAYAAMITYLDDQVGRILEGLRKLGLEKNTLVLFSSDNGATFSKAVEITFFNSNGGLRGAKMDLYEGGIREPFIARWPGRIEAGRTSDHVSVQYDVMATLAELTGQKVAYTDGVSFLPELLGNTKSQQQHAYLYFEYPENGGQVAIRMGEWKGVRTGVKKNRQVGWQIYNLRTDPKETTNLAEQQPELVKTFDAIVQKEHQHAHIQEWEFIDPKFEGSGK
jgi:arylsulfatase A-like enzyme